MSRSAATLSNVARVAAVSPSTVSKVLNGRAGVSAQTRERVEKALHDEGYHPLGGRRSQPLIELVFDSIDSSFAMEIIRGVQRAAAAQAMSVVLTETGDRHAPGPEWIDRVVQRHPVGVVLVSSDLPGESKRRLALRGIPFVVLDPSGDPAPDVPSVGSANWSGGMLAARHLLDLGHRSVGVICGPHDMLCSRARLSGYRTALEDAGVPVDEGAVRWGDFHREDGVRLGHELLERPERPTAIWACNDLMALGVLEAARDLGLRVPEDLSVMGYDDLDLARWSDPPLTTVRQPLAEMGEQAALLATGAVREGARAPRIDLATSLVERASTARCPSC